MFRDSGARSTGVRVDPNIGVVSMATVGSAGQSPHPAGSAVVLAERERGGRDPLIETELRVAARTGAGEPPASAPQVWSLGPPIASGFFGAGMLKRRVLDASAP